MTEKKGKKIIFIPGWMNTLETYKKYDGLEIWKDDFCCSEEIQADFVIGHSLGANFILHNWEKFKNTKIILVNPLLPKHSCWKWFVRFLKFSWKEGIYPERKLISGVKYIFGGFWKAFQLVKWDLYETLKKIPQENLFIIKGGKDYFFWEAEEVYVLNEIGINFIELDEVGHNWHGRIDEEVEKIVNSKW